jgi:hypothetical protein
MNIDILDNNMIMRRRGIRKVVPESAHSLFPVGNKYCLFGSGTGLWILLPEFAGYRQIATVTSGNISYAMVDGVVYWANGYQRGEVVDGVNLPWTKAETVYSNNQTRTFYDPPTGRLLGWYKGRMYVVEDKVIWYSEPFSPDVFALADSFLSFESTVTMIRPVAGGVYISDAEQTWFLAGEDPKEFSWKVVDYFPALPYSDAAAAGTMAANEAGDMVFSSGGKREVAFWLTNDGIMFGDGAGDIINLTEKRIDLVFPAVSGAILVDGTNLVAQFG